MWVYIKWLYICPHEQSEQRQQLYALFKAEGDLYWMMQTVSLEATDIIFKEIAMQYLMSNLSDVLFN